MELKQEQRMLCLFLYISGLHGIGIFVFTRGFLLTRNELPLFSHCDDLQHDEVGCNLAYMLPSISNSSSFHAVSEEDDCTRQTPTKPKHIATKPHCWTPPAVKKVVILVFDALRFDFVAPSSLLKDKKRPWMDRLQVVQKLISEESSRARLFKFIADPPTTSLQRLKGLTTGSLPTFIDVGNSFGAPAIVEDNIIKQLTSNGKKVIMMGDDTWLDLFPSQFFQAFPFPSFNVKDLHTVDNGVLENLFPALYEDNWDVLIGHFLGVDHVGHIFGVESTQMVEKLEQYNKVVEDVIAILRNESQKHDETLLLVLGDHGQTLNGDHGGGTLEEVETALFAWSAQQPTHPVSQSCDSSCISHLDIPPSLVRESNYCICNFQQLDFAATFAAIIGIPFPYGSIGKVDPQLFGLVARMWQPSQHNNTDMDEDKMPMVEWQKLYNTVLCLNSWQVNRYFQQYSKSSINGFSPYDLDILHTFYNDAQSFSREWSVRAANLDAEMALLGILSTYRLLLPLHVPNGLNSVMA